MSRTYNNELLGFVNGITPTELLKLRNREKLVLKLELYLTIIRL